MSMTNSRTVKLGRTGLDVCRIGIGGGNGMSSDVVRHAMSKGVNYVFYSSDLHPMRYGNSREAIREVCRAGSTRRDEMVLAAASYICDPEKVLACVVDQIQALGVDHVDVFHWGWVTRRNTPEALLESADELLCKPEGAAFVREFAQVTRQVADELRCRGYARFLGVSTHDRLLAAELANNPLVDILMIRYNVAHRKAEEQIFPHLPTKRPGMVSFNTCHDGRGLLVHRPPGISQQKYAPSFSDLYRFSLDRPELDVVLAGPMTTDDVDAALEALERGPLEARLHAYLEKYGDVCSGRAIVQTC